MTGLIVGVAVVVVLFLVAGACFEADYTGAGLGYLISGAIGLYLIVILGAPKVFTRGDPTTYIRAGEYKVAFVHQARDNVSVGVESVSGSDKVEHLNLYQFKKNAFEGDIKANATKLVVIEAGSFKKLRLE